MSRIVHVEVGRFDYEMIGDFKFLGWLAVL
jgi:hypothetical protein